MSFHRKPGTQHERRESAQAEADHMEDPEVPMPRAKRNHRNLTDAWDDQPRGRKGRGWKAQGEESQRGKRLRKQRA